MPWWETVPMQMGLALGAGLSSLALLAGNRVSQRLAAHQDRRADPSRPPRRSAQEGPARRRAS
ncbi:MAG TPA: hypothetical protein VGR21_01300 [Cryptosporangiaceae bacterium]|nr:hypothetical protein [Cryptosporangiaceae bacterium]